MNRPFAGRGRLLVLAALMLLGFLALGIKLFQEQFFRGETYHADISRQSIRRIRIPALRGRIYTADLLPLAENADSCSLFLYPEELRIPGGRRKTIARIQTIARDLARAIGREAELDEKEILRHLEVSPGLPMELFRHLTPQEQAWALECARGIGGISLEFVMERAYPRGRLACHLIGYTRKEHRDEAEDKDDYSRFYYVGDESGKAGLEAALDRPAWLPENIRGLRGRPGSSLVQVDNLGFIRQTLIEQVEPLNGNHVILTLDAKAQKLGEDILAERPGAFVLLDGISGDVLAAASSPGYDLAEFTPKLLHAYYQSLLENTEKPLFNRVLSGTFPPGSIVKPLVALALQKAGVSPDEKILCDGYSRIGNQSIRCASYRSGGHGEVDMETALERSCNSYFIQMTLRFGVDILRETYRAAGLGQSVDLELANARGEIPDPDLKFRRKQGRWSSFDTGLASIGQGMLTLTPLQAALFAAALGNGGKVPQPHLLKAIVDQSGTELFRRGAATTSVLLGTPEMLEVVSRGMHRVVNAPTGSGRAAKNSVIELYGKTGSAELGSITDRTQDVWFICYGRHKGRLYAAAMVLQRGRSGGSDCAPLIAEFFRRYLE